MGVMKICVSVIYEPAINIFLQQTSVFSVKCFIHEKEERKGKKRVVKDRRNPKKCKRANKKQDPI